VGFFAIAGSLSQNSDVEGQRGTHFRCRASAERYEASPDADHRNSDIRALNADRRPALQRTLLGL
jgi:hypothetical protein